MVWIFHLGGVSIRSK